MYCIYLILNTITGKLYVGKTDNVDRRLKDHLKIARGGKQKYPNSYFYLHAAINKYGFDNFLIKTVAENLSDEKLAFELEKMWIFSLKQSGYDLYNLTDGGDGTSGHKISEEGRRKMSKAHLGKEPWNIGKTTPLVVRVKQSKSAINRFKNNPHPTKGKISPFKGKKRSEEFKIKISNTKTGVAKTREHILATSKLTEKQVKEIKILLKEGVPNKEIAQKFSVQRDTISRIKNGKTWKWLE